MKDYSQNGEQRQILDYFGYRFDKHGEVMVAPRAPGTVLDVGSNDGILLSNSRALIELGWSAVLVEPAETAFAKLLANNGVTGSGRKPDDFSGTPGQFHAMISGGKVMAPGGRVILIQAAITTQDGPIEFHSSGTHLKKGDTDLLSTTRPEELARWKKSGEVFTKTTVRGITFDTLMRETGVSHFDFITIDAEGADYDILKQIDLTAVGCRLLCVEVNARGDAEFTAYAKKHGMRLVWSSYENRIYSR